MPLKEPSWWYGRSGDSGRSDDSGGNDHNGRSGDGGGNNRGGSGNGGINQPNCPDSGTGDSGAINLVTKALMPLSVLYGWIGLRRFQNAAPYRSTLPVICVGNFTAGGTGKTPMSIALAQLLMQMGEHPAFLTRGYGGTTRGPYWVNTETDRAAEVGDEPLLLSRHAPTMIARDRRAGAQAIEREESPAASGFKSRPTVIIMDDGMQNPALHKDLTVALVSAARGVGNGRVIPAGPLRLPLSLQFSLADCVVLTGPPPAQAGANPAVVKTELPILSQFSRPILRACPKASADSGWLSGTRVLAFAGIAAPKRFYDLLEELGAQLIATCSFNDHQALSDRQANELLAEAAKQNAQIVTTQKDYVRLAGADGSPLCQLRAQSRALAISMSFPAGDKLQMIDLLRRAVARK